MGEGGDGHAQDALEILQQASAGAGLLSSTCTTHPPLPPPASPSIHALGGVKQLDLGKSDRGRDKLHEKSTDLG